jgi:hypothetical protein
MADIVLDTDALADFLRQFFGPADRGHSPFTASRWLSRQTAAIINRIVAVYNSTAPVTSHVVASTLAFAEIVRKWRVLLGRHVSPEQLRAFLEDPPEWFLVAAVDATLLPFCCQLPGAVRMGDGSMKPVEWTDAIHAATALSRTEPHLPPCYLGTHDTRIVRIPQVSGVCI